MKDRWSEVEALFMRAADLPVVESDSFLDEACKGDDSLRAELLSLLDCDTPEVPLVTQSLLAPPGGQKAGGDVAGERIGAYKLVRLLGRGGMGAVYLATRADDQYNKEVAIKL